MKKLIIKTFVRSLIGFTFLGVTAAWGSQDITFGDPIAYGSGCPGGVTASLSYDSTSLSILYDNFLVEAGQNNLKFSETKQCEIEIPVQIPKGKMLKLVKVDLRGYLFASERGAKATVYSRYALKNGSKTIQGNTYSRNYQGPLDELFELSEDMGIPYDQKCGGENFTISMRTALRAQVDNLDKSVLVSMDSTDLTHQNSIEGIYAFELVPCKNPRITTVSKLQLSPVFNPMNTICTNPETRNLCTSHVFTQQQQVIPQVQKIQNVTVQPNPTVK